MCCPVEGSLPLPQCDRCGLQISYAAMNGRHYETAMCREGVARKAQHAAAERTHLALQQTFTVYDGELERVEVFKYLGRLLAYDDNDSQAVRGNLKKAQGVWARLSRTMRARAGAPAAVLVSAARVRSVPAHGRQPALVWFSYSAQGPTPAARPQGYLSRHA